MNKTDLLRSPEIKEYQRRAYRLWNQRVIKPLVQVHTIENWFGGQWYVSTNYRLHGVPINGKDLASAKKSCQLAVAGQKEGQYWTISPHMYFRLIQRYASRLASGKSRSSLRRVDRLLDSYGEELFSMMAEHHRDHYPKKRRKGKTAEKIQEHLATLLMVALEAEATAMGKR